MTSQPIKLTTPAEVAAYQEGQRIRDLMGSLAYRRREPGVVAEVTAAFQRAYPGKTETAAIWPGQGPAGGFDRE